MLGKVEYVFLFFVIYLKFEKVKDLGVLIVIILVIWD